MQQNKNRQDDNNHNAQSPSNGQPCTDKIGEQENEHSLNGVHWVNADSRNH